MVKQDARPAHNSAAVPRSDVMLRGLCTPTRLNFAPCTRGVPGSIYSRRKDRYGDGVALSSRDHLGSRGRARGTARDSARVRRLV